MVNEILPQDVGEKVYTETLRSAIREAFEILKPDLVGVSAGFDTLSGDLASLGLALESYWKIGKNNFRIK